ncbi:MAG: hypothetical protein AAGI13_08970 [Pseudomonadota bacterium]
MNMLAETLAGISSSPYAWCAVAVLAAISIYSVVAWRICPVLNNADDISIEEAEKALNRPVTAGPRFLLMMLAGIAALIAGLYMVYRAADPGIAFVLVVTGLVVTQTEPARLMLRETTNRVVAARTSDEMVQQAAMHRLATNHLWLMATHFIILVSVIAALLVF